MLKQTGAFLFNHTRSPRPGRSTILSPKIRGSPYQRLDPRGPTRHALAEEEVQLVAETEAFIVLGTSSREGQGLSIAGLDVGVANLSAGARWAFLATNLPYFVVAATVHSYSTVPASCDLPAAWPLIETNECPFGAACSSPAFFASVILLLGLVSTYWHGAQSRLAPALYCRARLQTPRWQRRLIVSDISCSCLTFTVGLACFGVARTVEWLLPALALFVAGSVAKRRRRYAQYAVIHGLWHAISAGAIHNIVLVERTPLAFLYTLLHNSSSSHDSSMAVPPESELQLSLYSYE